MSERFESGYLNSTPSFENSTLGVLTYRPESHVAQQRRRDKLRTPQTVTPSHHSHDIPNHLLQLPSESGLNPDLVQVRSVTNCDSLYYPPMFSSEMLNFSMNSHVLMGHKDAQQEPSGAQSSRPTGPDDVPFGGNSSKITGPQNPCHWKGIGSQPSCDWIVNYVSGSGGNAPLFVGETLPGNLKEPNLSSSAMFMNADGCNGYQDVQSSVTNASNGELNFGSPSLYHSALQEVVTSSTMGRQGFDMASLGQQNNRESSHCAWVDGGDEPVVLPIYGNHFGAPRVNDSDSWMHRQEEGSNNQWNDELGFGNGRSGRQLDRAAGESTSRGLSLSLSSHAPSKHNVAFGERFVSENLQSRGEMCSGSQDSRPNSAGYLCSGSKPSVGNPFHGMVGSSVYPRRSIGPLGPFTGYATVLKNSKYLQPAQQLLDDICTVTGSKLIRTCGSSERGSREVSNSSEHINAGNEVRGMGESSDVSSFNSSNQAGGDGRSGTGPCQLYHPEFQQKKAKLLYMQEEVCRRYKQYHQQMQMVVSSFESVAGLSCATPYTSLALKAVTRHFRCLKNAISDQIKHITKTLGDEFLSPMDGTISKGDSTVHKLRSIDQNLRKQQAGGDRIGFIDTRAPQHPIWRPQRGLPERAVTVLRAWLFEHFLHPYPTDTDKHMLATQTGLSRNQVSNWFINARVRVWKPMVEEMHNLEKGSTETDHASGINYQNPNNDSNAGCSNDQSSNKLMIDAMSDKPPESLSIQPVPAEVGESSEQWFREKRSRVEHPIPPDVDSGLIGFVPYHHNGLGAVSLTLGLQHNTDHHQQQQQQQQQLRHYGGQIFHDYMG